MGVEQQRGELPALIAAIDGEAADQRSANVLRRLRLQMAGERRDDEAGAHRVAAMSRRCAVRARRNAGDGFGGVPSAAASAR